MGNQIAKEESKINLPSNSVLISSPAIGIPSTPLAWCSNTNNNISVIDLETKQNYVTIDGAMITKTCNYITGFDFSPAGDSIATIDRHGMCLMSNVNTDNYGFHLQFESKDDLTGRCRWSTKTDEPLLFVKYNWSRLSILDVEKNALILSIPVQLDLESYTFWIDVCQINANLLASGGSDKAIRISDKRESKIVRTFNEIHSDIVNCVRWNPTGDMIAIASLDKTAKLLDFKTGKVIYTGTTSDGSYVYSVCFI